MKSLPPGVFYDARRESPRKYRVRVYHNYVAHLGGYFETSSEAIEALAALKKKLEKTPRSRGTARPMPKPSTEFVDLARRARER